jgi:hypothetical protein
VELAGALANHRLLDRLIRSRIWIAVIAFALIGIVAMQLWVLKLNGGIGRAIEHESLLTRENATLSATDAEMSAGDRVEQRAAGGEGMVMVPPGALRFLATRGALDARLAVAALGRATVQAPAAVPTGTATAAASGETSSTAAATSTPTAGAPSGEAGPTVPTTSPSSAASGATPGG